MSREYFFNFEKYAYVKGSKPKGCILCLVRDEDERVVNLTVYRDELFLVSVNLYPYNPGHLLLFPVRHVRDVRELSPAEELHLIRLQRYFLGLLDTLHRPAGYNIGYNMGLVTA